MHIKPEKTLSIIIPVRNEAENIQQHLQSLQTLRQEAEIILIDGQSSDATTELATPYCDLILSSQAGRAQQMNTGAKQASSSRLLFLHADTVLPDNALDHIKRALDQKDWGRFDIKLSGSSFMLRIIEKMMNLRSRLSKIATGDQAIFVKKTLFEKVGMYENIPIMEDIALCKQLRQHSSPAFITAPATTSSRRWEKQGIWLTILLMWRLRLAYAMGVSPDKLVSKYYPS